MSGVFISYRRDDSPYSVHMIRDALAAGLPKDSVYLDVHNIPPGADFREHVELAIERRDVLLIVIGRSWFTARAPGGARRIDMPTDMVRLEIEVALKANLCVIPVLVDGAIMPPVDALPTSIRDLAFRNAFELSPGSDLKVRLDQLTSSVAAELRARESKRKVVQSVSMRVSLDSAPGILETIAWRKIAIGVAIGSVPLIGLMTCAVK